MGDERWWAGSVYDFGEVGGSEGEGGTGGGGSVREHACAGTMSKSAGVCATPAD